MIIAIIGGGAAGIACALSLQEFGHQPVIIEREPLLGGIQRVNFHRNHWLPGFGAPSGQQLATRLTRDVLRAGVEIAEKHEVRAIARASAGFRLQLMRAGRRTQMTAAAVVIATGARPRPAPQFARFAGRAQNLFIGPGSRRIQTDIRSARVAVLGGGDNAFDHALSLACRRNTVDVIMAGTPRARPQFVAKARTDHCITLRRGAIANVALENGQFAFDVGTARERYDYVLVMYGFAPNTEFVAASKSLGVRLAPDGFVAVNLKQQTSVRNIYAAGDVTNLQLPSVATAVGQGVVAARWIDRNLKSC
jgi:thioredoxin reductase